MGVSLGALGTYVGSFFTAAGTAGAAGGTAAAAGGAAAGAGTAAATAGELATVTVTAGAGAGVGAGTAAGVAAGAAGGAAAGATLASSGSSTPAAATPGVANTPAPAQHPLLRTIDEAAAVASGASALYTLANGPGQVNVPPAPQSAQVDQSVLAADQAQKQRQMAAGGLPGTTGTPGGQQGALLNPATMSKAAVLGG